MAGTAVPVLTLPFQDAEQLPLPTTEGMGAESGTSAHLWKFRSPVVLQHSDIIIASILRIAASRNVGGLGFSSLLVLTFTFANSVSLLLQGEALLFFPCIITENGCRVKVHLFPE